MDRFEQKVEGTKKNRVKSIFLERTYFITRSLETGIISIFSSLKKALTDRNQ